MSSILATNPTADKTARVHGPLRKVFAFPGVDTQYYIEEDYRQEWAYWKPLALNSAHTTYRSYYLVEESSPRTVGATDSICEWTRTYAPIFTAWSEYQDCDWTHPSIVIGSLTYDFIPTKTSSRLEHCFFLLGVSMQDGDPYLDDDPALADHVNVKIETPSQIMRRYPKSFFDSIGNMLGNSVINAVATLVEDVNGVDKYNSWSDAEFAAIVATGTEIVAENSTIQRWRGNLFERITRYVTPVIW